MCAEVIVNGESCDNLKALCALLGVPPNYEPLEYDPSESLDCCLCGVNIRNMCENAGAACFDTDDFFGSLAVITKDHMNTPKQFICTYKINNKKALLRIRFWNGEWLLERWSSAGYWSTNGGGPITEAKAFMLFKDGIDVMEIKERAPVKNADDETAKP